MGRGVVFAGCLVVAMLACLGGTAAATEYFVEWAAGKNFKGGDTLKFVWNGTHNVANVSKEEYDSCTKVSSVFQGGDPFAFTLPADANGLYYFICTVDSHCENGQKLAITAISPTPSHRIARLP
ncbi:hypothetical protein BT93_F1915 [Corymbia citriodora subsp. variegata]|nr:hypothetical protein BT93_F1915 [Corymbia citriodora subsp. variegata]